jgi:hypothetical protein
MLSFFILNGFFMDNNYTLTTQDKIENPKTIDTDDKIALLHDKIVDKLEEALDVCEIEGLKLDAIVRAYAQLLDAKAKLTSVSNEGVVIRVEYSDLSSNE